MTALVWDKTGERRIEYGADHGVLYLLNAGVYDTGVAWNGLTTVTESPSGAESTPQYADNMKYVVMRSAETFGGTIEAFTYPDEFAQCDGSATPSPGVSVGQQSRETFGFSYRTLIGTDTETEAGYKLHLVYGATAAPSERAFATVNDSPEAVALSWEFDTVPVPVTGLKPTALITIDSTKVPALALAALEDELYGTAGSDANLPLPDAVLALFAGSVTEVETVAPTYDSGTDMITIPSVTGVQYYIAGELVTGAVGPITEDTVVTALPAPGYSFTETSDSDWTFNFA
jgi:hypothetical protein